MDGSYVTKNFISNSVTSVFFKVSPIWYKSPTNWHLDYLSYSTQKMVCWKQAPVSFESFVKSTITIWEAKPVAVAEKSIPKVDPETWQLKWWVRQMSQWEIRGWREWNLGLKFFHPKNPMMMRYCFRGVYIWIVLPVRISRWSPDRSAFSAAKDYGKPSLFRARSVLPTLNERPPLSDIQASRVQQKLVVHPKICRSRDVLVCSGLPSDCWGNFTFLCNLGFVQDDFFTLYHDKFWEIFFFAFSKHFMQIQVIDLFSVWMMPFKYNDVWWTWPTGI